jgi:ATP-dependent DNA helicase DinG
LDNNNRESSVDVNSFWEGKNFVALDIETTGLDPRKAEIIELGGVKYIDGKETETFSRIVKPSAELPVFIKQLTGIKEGDVASGIPVKQALTELQDFIGDYPLLCHNAGFDVGFIQHHLAILGLPALINPAYDTVEISRIYLPFIRNHKLETIAAAFDLPAGRYHRALNDAQVTGSIFLAMTSFILRYIPFELNVYLLELKKFLEIESIMEEYLKDVVDYQRLYALINHDKDNQQLFNSPIGQALGFTLSHNIISSKTEGTNSTEDIPFSADTESEIVPSAKQTEQDPILEKVFSEDGILHRSFPGFEYRSGQFEMAKAVDEAFTNKDYLLVEASTGVGKTFAYLVPALTFSAREGKKVFVSTNTKNLQEQIFFKDLPIIKKCLHLNFQAVILKGRDNYLCRRKWTEIKTGYRKLLSPYEVATLLNLVVWEHFTKTGDVSENSSFHRGADTEGKTQFSTVWRKIAADRYFCSGKKCSHFSKCCYMSIRQKADKSNLVITNHSLLLTDLGNDRFSKDEENYLIVDEAHNLPEMAPGFLGISLSFTEFNNLFIQLINIRKKIQTGILANLRAATQKSVIPEDKKTILQADIDKIIAVIEDCKHPFTDFFHNIGKKATDEGSFGKLRIKQDYTQFKTALQDLVKMASEIHSRLFSLTQTLMHCNKSQISGYSDHQEKLEGAMAKTKDLIEALTILIEPDLDNNAYWLSSFRVSDPSYPSGVLNYAPVDVSHVMKDVLFKHISSLIFTSATLALRESFKYFNLRMGINLIEDKKIRELIVQSPFDFDKQTMVLAAGFLPLPSDSYFSVQSIELLKAIIDYSRVGSMVLFTSYKDLNTVYDEIGQEMFSKNVLMLAQGREFSRTAMLNEFKDNGKAVLLGTSSFWEGVDVPGESLSLLVIYKLPFQVPSEPIVEAYYEKLKKEQKDPFMHSTLPNAMLRFRQGIGRLIRNKTDKGIVVVLDSRIINKRYGAYFREIVPTETHNTRTPLELYDLINNWYRAR